MDNYYNLIRLGEEVVNNPENVIVWCKKYGLHPTERQCRNCK